MTSRVEFSTSMLGAIVSIARGNRIGSQHSRISAIALSSASSFFSSPLPQRTGDKSRTNQSPMSLPMSVVPEKVLLRLFRPVLSIPTEAKSLDLARSCVEKAMEKCSRACPMSLVRRHSMAARFDSRDSRNDMAFFGLLSSWWWWWCCGGLIAAQRCGTDALDACRVRPRC